MKTSLYRILLMLAGCVGMQAQDLVITEVDVPDGPFVPNETVEIEVTIMNADDTVAVPAGSNFFVEATIDDGSTTFDVQSASINSPIGTEQTIIVIVPVLITNATENGFFNVTQVVVNPDETAFETNYANNTFSNPGGYEVDAYADLALNELELSRGPYYPGGGLSFTIDYSNDGDRDAGPFNIRVNVYAPPTGTHYTVNQAVPGLAAGQAASVTIASTIPLDNPNGVYEVEAILDPANDVDENGELANNVAETTFEIDTKPEMVISNLDYEAGVWEPGDPVDFSITVTNLPFWDGQGTLRVESRPDLIYTLNVVLSTDTEFGNEDDFLLYSVRIGGKPDGSNFLPGESYTIDWTQAMPRNLTGDYFVLAKVDVHEVVDEYVNDNPLLNGNNTWYDSETAKITIQPGPGPQPVTWRASVDGQGAQGDADSDEPSLSDDGRFLVFSSLSGLDEDDENDVFDIYLRDNLTGTVRWVSRPMSGVPGHADSRLPVISGDGRYIVFQSDSAALSAVDPTGHTNIYAYRVSDGSIIHVSRDPDGGPANGSSTRPAISSDGEWIVFESEAQNLLDPVEPTVSRQVYAYRISSGEIHRVSSTAGGDVPNGMSFESRVSGDGEFVVFTSEATDLTADVVSGRQVYRAAMDGSGTVLVSQESGAAGNGHSFNADISGDGNVVVFSSFATNLDPLIAVTNGISNVFIRDIAADATTRVVSPSGVEPNVPSNYPSGDVGVMDPRISTDGRFVIFRTQADNLLPLQVVRSDGTVFNLTEPGPAGIDVSTDSVILGYSDLNVTHTLGSQAHSDLYLYDRDNPQDTLMVSVNKFGYQGVGNFIVDNSPTSPSVRRGAISGNGRYIAFSSDARSIYGYDHGRTNLLSNNSNDARDVYIHDLRRAGAFEFANPPVVALLEPADGSTVTVGTTVILRADATDNGYIESLEFYINGVLHDSLGRDDYFSHWTPQLPGVYTIRVVATDNDGIRRDDSVTVVANDSQAPGVALTTPVTGETFFTSSTIPLGAVATTGGPGIVSVEFFADGISLGTVEEHPFTLDLGAGSLGSGDYTLTAVATNNVGQKGISNPVQITIVDPAAPLVQIVAPDPAGSWTVGTEVIIATTVTDSGALIDQVEIFINGQSAGMAESIAGVWYAGVTPVSLGVAEVRAVARDSSGNLYSSGTVSYPVVQGIAPQVTLLEPDPADTAVAGLADEPLIRGREYTFAVEASDADGTIQQVEYYFNGVSLGQATESGQAGRYELTHAPQLSGVQQFRAIATDDSGNRTVAVLDYNVISGGAPDVQWLSVPATVMRNSAVLLEASAAATAPGAVLESVAIYVDGELLGAAEPSVAVGDYQLTWMPVQSGLRTVEVVAVDSYGGTATASAVVSVELGQAPVVELFGDDDNDGVADEVSTVFEATLLEAVAQDNDGNIVSVEFFVDNASIGMGQLNGLTGRYELSWTPQALGRFGVGVVATDNDGNQSSDDLWFDVVSGQPPVVALQGDSDADGVYDDPVNLLEPLVLQAQASDPDGFVVSVTFEAVGEVLGTGVLNPGSGFYELEWTPSMLGMVTVTATAEDNGGNRVSDSLVFEVVRGAVPQIVWLSPDATDAAPADGVADQELLRNEPVEIRIEATDADGYIERVEVYANGRFVGDAEESDRVGEYALEFVPQLAGFNILRVVAMDNVGNRTEQSHVFHVSEGSVPVVAIVTPDPADADNDGIADEPLLQNRALVLSASAADADGEIEEVRFYVNGELAGVGEERDEFGIYEIEYTPELRGVLNLRVEATDNHGNVGVAVLDYNVIAGSAPMAQITAPDPTDISGNGVADELLRRNTPYVLTATAVATAPQSALVEVRFYANEVFLGNAEPDVSLGNYSLQWTPLLEGLWDIRVEVEDDLGSVSSDTVTYSVALGDPPVVSLTASDVADPGVADEAVPVFEPWFLEAAASDPDGNLVGVRFYVDGDLLGEGQLDGITGNYGIHWTPDALGLFRIDVVATDNDGNVSRDRLHFRVVTGFAPVVELLGDGSGDGYLDTPVPVMTPVTLVATATDPDGVVEQVEFFADSVSIGFGVFDVGAGGYAIEWTPAMLGDHLIEARATDNSGNVGQDSLFVEVTTGSVPTVSWLSPDPTDSNMDGIADQLLRVNESVVFAVDADDSDGFIDRVEFFINGVFAGNGQQRSQLGVYELDFTPELSGHYTFEVVVQDNSGNRIREEHTFNATTGPLPQITIMQPDPTDADGDGVADQPLLRGQTHILGANVVHPAGLIEAVEVWINGRFVGSAVERNALNVYELDWQPLLTGTYQVTFRAYDELGNVASRSLGYSVTAGTPPSVAILHPVDADNDGIADDVFVLGQEVELRVSAIHGDVSISSVEFFVNGSSIGNAQEIDTLNEFVRIFSPTLLGTHQFRAEVRDNAGNLVTVQQMFTVVSGSVPVVHIISPDPTDGNSDGLADIALTVGQQVTLAATATDSDGYIEQVRFFMNQSLLGSAGFNSISGHYERSFTFSQTGIYRFEVEATDNFGNRTTETAFYQVTSGVAPTVELIAPDPTDLDADGFADMTLQVNRPVQLVANAEDGDGHIQSVEFIVNGQSLGFAAESGSIGRYALDFTPVLTGNYRIEVVAVDDLGNVAQASHWYRVTPGIPPTISILSPPAGGSYLPGTVLPVQVVTSDSDGLVMQVDYYLNGVHIGAVFEPPFRTTVSLPGQGDFVLEAVATDNDGNRTVSAPRHLVAGPPDPDIPLVVINHPLPLGEGDTVNDVSVASAMYLNAEAVSLSGAEISDVRFYINGQLLGSATGRLLSTWSRFYQPNAQGNYVIMAEAEDVNGNVGQSVPILLDVGPLDSPLPIAAMRDPFPFSPADKPIEMFVDVDGGLVDIDRVDFFANGVLIGSQSASVQEKLYRFVWTPPSEGTYMLSSRIVQIDPADLEWDNWKMTGEVAVEVTPAPADTPPSVVLHYPADGAELTTASRVIVQAGSADTDSNVDRVEFYINNQLAGSSANAPYQFTWIPGEAGNYAIVAVAYDPDGNYTISTTHRVVVHPSGGFPPFAQIVSPNPADADGDGVADQILLADAPTRFAARAVDPDGLVDVVEFYVNGILIGEAEPTPEAGIWEFYWEPQTVGRINFVVVVRDTLGNENFARQSYQVDPTVPPTVAITGPDPTDNSGDGVADVLLGINRNHKLVAMAHAFEGRHVQSVEFYNGAALLGEASESVQQGRYELTWRPPLQGVFEIVAVVTDSLGLTAIDRVFYEVFPGEVPEVTFISPVGVQPTVGSDVIIEVDAFDLDGYVDNVEFFVNELMVGDTVTESPFYTLWRPGSAGEYRIEARATDNSGNVVSAFHTVTVVPEIGDPPSINLSALASGNITPGSRMIIRANVIDDNPESVTFFLDGRPISTQTEAPYYVVIDPVISIPPNMYEVAAIVVDADGNSRIDRQAYYISDVPVDLPEVEIANPRAGDQLTFGSRAAIRADVTGFAAREIEEVLFYANGVIIGSDDTEPYMMDWIPNVLGDVEITAAVLLTARMYDHDFTPETPDIRVTPINIALPRTVTVNPEVGELPSISMQILPARENLAIGSRVLLFADVQDIDGDLEDLSVEFFIDGAPLRRPDGQAIGPVTEPPFATSWITDRQGRFFLNATVTDADNNVVASSYRNIDVSSRVVTETPTLQLSVPQGGRQGSFMTFGAQVEKFVNGPESVVFYVNGEPVGEVENLPYTFNWLANLSGEVQFFATAKRILSDGAVLTTVSPVSIRTLAENVAPVITTFDYTFAGEDPSTKPNPLLGDQVRFQIVVNNDGPLQRTELLRDGEVIAQSTQSSTPIELVDTPPGLGTFQYSLIVTDRAGAQTQSAAPLEVLVTQGQPPVVEIVSPAQGFTSIPNISIPLRAVASDLDGFVVDVQFFVNGQAIGQPITQSPYQSSYTPQTPGDYQFTARARDNSGNVTMSSPVTVTVPVDDPPTFTAFENDLSANIARLNQPIRWTVEADDDFGVFQVVIFRNNQPLPNPEGVDVPVEFTDVPPNTGVFTYFAEATDTGGNVTRSASVPVTVTRGTAPTVSITSPQNGQNVAVGSPVTVRATATPASESGGVPQGSITRVEFRRNGQPFEVMESAPYIASFTPTAEAEYTITAIATSDTGLTATAEVMVFGFDGSVPEILSFTNSTTNNTSLTGVNIQFVVEAFDERGIDRVELVQGNQLVGTVFSSPYRINVRPESPGVYSYFVRVINPQGRVAVSDSVEILVRYPEPLTENNDFVYQTFLDLLLRAPTSAEQNNFASRLESGNLSKDRFIQEVMEIDGGDGREYDRRVQDVFSAHWLLRGVWPDRNELERDAGIVQDGTLAGLVEEMLPAFENRYVSEVNAIPELRDRLQEDVTKLPDVSSPDLEIETFLQYLFLSKYGVLMNNDQKAHGRGRFIAFGRKQFMELFIRDLYYYSTSQHFITTELAFRFNRTSPPSERVRLEARAASLMVNLWRERVDPAEVTAMAERMFVTQVNMILNDPRYEARFLTPFQSMRHLSDGWKDTGWFGWFNSGSAPHNFHTEFGWISFRTAGQSSSNFWFHDSKLEWNWTREGLYPYFFNLNEGIWLKGSGRYNGANGAGRPFLDIRSGEWIIR